MSTLLRAPSRVSLAAFLVAAAVNLISAGCGDDVGSADTSTVPDRDSGNDASSGTCVPNAAEFCTCAGGADGVRTCSGDGRWAPCDCSTPVGPDTGRADTGASGTADADTGGVDTGGDLAGPDSDAAPDETGVDSGPDAADTAPDLGPDAGTDTTPPTFTDDGYPSRCGECHGDMTTPAPPMSTLLEMDTSATGVGAHRSHVGASDWHVEVPCGSCHRVPTSEFDPGHQDTPLPAELTFTGHAVDDGARPAWNGTSCSNVYCHGATLAAGGTHTTPSWTIVDGTQSACGSCHATASPTNALGGEHSRHVDREGIDCSECHQATAGPGRVIRGAAQHINGTVEWDMTGTGITVVFERCNGLCHGKLHALQGW